MDYTTEEGLEEQQPVERETRVTKMEKPADCPETPAELQPIFWRSAWREPLLCNPSFVNVLKKLQGLTDHHAWFLRKENQGFELVGDGAVAKIDDLEERRLVAAGEKPCPHCKGTEYAGEVRRLYAGRVTGVKVWLLADCYCGAYRLFHRHWTRNVGTDYQGCSMESIWTPEYRGHFPRFSKGQVIFLQRLIETFPGHSMLLAGPAGCGKSTVLTALYNRALGRWSKRCWERHSTRPAVWYIKAQRLVDEYLAAQNWDPKRDETSIQPRPTVLSTDVPHARHDLGVASHLFLDELDKYKLGSDYQNNKFHDLIDVIKADGGQVVAVSNLNLEQLRASIGYQHADGLLRRLIGEPNGIYVDFWKGEVYVNYQRVSWREQEGGVVYLDQFLSCVPKTSTGKIVNAMPVTKIKAAPAAAAPTSAPAATSEPEEEEPEVDVEEDVEEEVEETIPQAPPPPPSPSKPSIFVPGRHSGPGIKRTRP